MSLYFWCFFFFKQKTAYEMRISDWSSDVCSSDLPCQGMTPECIAKMGCAAPVALIPPLAFEAMPPFSVAAPLQMPVTPLAGRETGDRKSVVSGKSVSVRVDLGGRRIIKQKNIQHITHITTEQEAQNRQSNT